SDGAALAGRPAVSQHPELGYLLLKRKKSGPRVIARGVIDKNYFEGPPIERSHDLESEGLDVLRLVPHRRDNAELGATVSANHHAVSLCTCIHDRPYSRPGPIMREAAC